MRKKFAWLWIYWEISYGVSEMDLIQEIINRDLRQYLETKEGHRFKRNMTLCPFHDDHVESMNVSQKSGSWVWYCHACKTGGGIIEYVMGKYDLSKQDSVQKLKEHFGITETHGRKKAIAKYAYVDEDGCELFIKERYIPKGFHCKRKTENGYVYNLNGVRRILYNLPAVIASAGVWIVEGEKDADTLEGLGLTATSAPFGVGDWLPEFTKHFKDKEVAICLDKGCEDISKERAVDLVKVAKSVKIVELPGLENGQDITDWAEGLGKISKEEKLKQLIKIYNESPVFTAVPTIADSAEKLIVENDFLKSYCESISRSTDAPNIFVLFSGIALLSAVLSKFHFYYPLKTHLNLYILLLAPSTFCRKTVCLDISNDYLRDVNEELCLPESFTPEALFSILQDQSRGIIFWREFNQVKEFIMGKEYSKGIPELLTDIYDFKKRWTRRIKSEKEPIVLESPILSILAAGVTDWFTKNLKEIDFQGGLWTRFLFVPAPEEKKTYHWPRKFIFNPVVSVELKKLNDLEASEIDLSEVKTEITEWGTNHMKQAQELDSDLFKATFQRLEVMLLKIAALLQLSQDYTPVVKLETFREAVKIIEFLKKRLATFFNEEIQFGDNEKRKMKVLKYIKKKKKVEYSILLRNVRVKANQLKAILHELKAEGRIKWEGSLIEIEE